MKSDSDKVLWPGDIVRCAAQYLPRHGYLVTKDGYWAEDDHATQLDGTSVGLVLVSGVKVRGDEACAALIWTYVLVDGRCSWFPEHMLLRHDA